MTDEDSTHIPRLVGPLTLHGIAPVDSTEEDAALLARIPQRAIEAAGHPDVLRIAKRLHMEQIDAHPGDSLDPWEKLPVQNRYSYMRIALSQHLREEVRLRQSPEDRSFTEPAMERGLRKAENDSRAFWDWLLTKVTRAEREEVVRATGLMSQRRFSELSFADRMGAGRLLAQYGAEPENDSIDHGDLMVEFGVDAVRIAATQTRAFLYLHQWASRFPERSFSIEMTPDPEEDDEFWYVRTYWNTTLIDRATGSDIRDIAYKITREP